ncbi:hypothetical protein [Halomonas aquatica]|uniref:Uncharacterized protein n=1 Tax=Halomonas aquatica TaxID=3151123 RepID=A0ABV1NGC2_9GAMM
MPISPLHDWDLAPMDAISLQKRLAGRVSYTAAPFFRYVPCPRRP